MEGRRVLIRTSARKKAENDGADDNWGGELCAMGYWGAEIEKDSVRKSFRTTAGEIGVCIDGGGHEFEEELAKKILTEHEVEILITVAGGDACVTCWGCDLTYDYVKINGAYRT